MPFAGGSLDAVTVAQAFHWFDADRAFAELHRVLRPGGRVGLIWNARDRSVDWVDRVWSIMDRVEKRAPWREHDQWHDSALGERAGFGPLHDATFHHEQPVSPDDVVERVRSVSHVAVLPPAEQARVLDEVRDLLATASRDPWRRRPRDPLPGRRLLVRTAVTAAPPPPRPGPGPRWPPGAPPAGRRASPGGVPARTISGRVMLGSHPDLLARAGAATGSRSSRPRTARRPPPRCSPRRSPPPGRPVVTNHTGANLAAGVAATLAPPHPPSDAVLEVDERVLPLVVDPLAAQLLVLGNLTRDQLDRYGEVRSVGDRWRAVAEAHPDLRIVANVVRPARGLGRVAGPHHVGRPRRGLAGRRGDVPGLRSAARVDAPTARTRAAAGSRRRPRSTAWWATPCTSARRRSPIELALPGRWNVLERRARDRRGRRAGRRPARRGRGGRGGADRVGPLRDRTTSPTAGRARVLLAKNPAGWSEVLAWLARRDRGVVLAVNAHVADGRDTSWLWDAPFELLRGRTVAASGERATDVAVRLDYDGVDCFVEPDPIAAAARVGGTEVDVVASYTQFTALTRRLAR